MTAASVHDERPGALPGAARSGPRRPRATQVASSGRTGRVLLGAVPPVALLVLWQLAKSTGLLPYDSLPSPVEVVLAFVELAGGTVFWTALGHTLLATVGGWLIGSAAGLALGIALGASAATRRWSMTSIQVLRAVPAIAFVSIAVIVFSQTLTMEVLIAAWVAVWPVAISAMEGIHSVSGLHREVAHSLRLGPIARLTKIELPTAAPTIVVSLRLSLGGALALAIVSEMVGNPAGIGYQLVQQQLALRSDAMFAYVIVIGFVGLGLNALVSRAAVFVPGARNGRTA